MELKKKRACMQGYAAGFKLPMDCIPSFQLHHRGEERISEQKIVGYAWVDRRHGM
jgi:hypothetical protein